MGFVACYNHSPIVWLSWQQPFAALSTAEAEYMALATGLQEESTLERTIISLIEGSNSQSHLNVDN